MLFTKRGDSATPEEKSRGRLLVILIGAVLGILLLVFGGELTEQQEEQDDHALISAEQDLNDYRKELEERIRLLCESVEGVGGVHVAVTLECGYEEVYATETVNGEERPVIVGSGSSASALPITRREPVIAGIGVVCRGGSNSDVRRELIALLSSAFHVSGNRIYVTEAKRS